MSTNTSSSSSVGFIPSREVRFYSRSMYCFDVHESSHVSCIFSIQDYFYRHAKEEGFRARSAYKLLHVDEVLNIFKGVTRAVDLCAAPGSWSQLLARELTKNATDAGCSHEDVKIAAVDLQEMAPIPGVNIIQGDITLPETADRIVNIFEGKHAQLVVCDGAPDVTGLHQVDEYLQSQLLFAAIAIAARVSQAGAAFCAKIFKGDCLDLLITQLQCLYEQVDVIKPSSSRIRSAEHFIVGRNFRYGATLPPMLGTDDTHMDATLRTLRRRLAMGDLDE